MRAISHQIGWMAMALLMHILPTLQPLSLAADGQPHTVPSEVHTFGLAMDFLSRYIDCLKAPATQDSADRIRRTQEGGFRYTIGGDNDLRHLDGSEDFSIALEAGLYTASWQKGGKVLAACQFPANITLLTGLSIIELETAMLERLHSLPEATPRDVPEIRAETVNKIALSEFYLHDNGYYITPRLKNQVVYAPVAGQPDVCRMLIDTEHYQLESLANVMLTGYFPHKLTAETKVTQYGYKSETVTVRMSDLFEAFAADGCKPYWGVETFDGVEVKGLYVWENQMGGYNHVLSVSIPIRALTADCMAKATLHSFVRMDNLKSMFEDYPNL